MTQSALIIGNGISGLLLALSLCKKQWRVTVLSQPGLDPGDSPLICPEIVMNFVEELIPGSHEELKRRGARHSRHEEMIKAKFPAAHASNPGEFLFLGRKLLLEHLKNHAEKAGVIFREEKTTSLQTDKGNVTGVNAGENFIEANYTFDCTGTFLTRSVWLKGLVRTGEIMKTSGREEVMFIRFYESSRKPQLRLRSGEKFRGGIYPMEGNRFAISMLIPSSATQENPEILLKDFIRFIGAEEDILESSSTSPWIRKDHIINIASNFYLSNFTNELRNFYVVGDGLIFSNPIYGRGIALTIYQLQGLLKNDDIVAGLKTGFKDSYKKWSEVASEKNTFPYRLLRRFYLYLLEREPVVYEAFLDFYQLRRSPVELLWAVLKSPLSLKMISLLVLTLSCLIWVSLSCLQ